MSAARRGACLLAMLLLAGCATKWEVQHAPAAEVIEFSDGDEYLVTRTSGAQVQLREAKVERDSLIGVETDDPTGPALNARRAIALTDIRSIAVRKPDGVAATFWIAAVGTLVVALAIGALLSSISASGT